MHLRDRHYVYVLYLYIYIYTHQIHNKQLCEFVYSCTHTYTKHANTCKRMHECILLCPLTSFTFVLAPLGSVDLGLSGLRLPCWAHPGEQVSFCGIGEGLGAHLHSHGLNARQGACTTHIAEPSAAKWFEASGCQEAKHISQVVKKKVI